MRNQPDHYQEIYCSAKDGLRLAGRKYGWQNRDPHPIICLTDFARNSSDFHELALFLTSSEGGKRRVLTLDYRGHGNSDHDKNKNNYSIIVEAEDVVTFATAVGIGEFDIIGTGRGGMIAMLLGNMRASSLNKIILNDIGPSIDARGLIHMKKLYEQFHASKSLDQVASVLAKFGARHFPSLPPAYWSLETDRLFQEKDGKLFEKNDPYLSSIIRDIDLESRPDELWPQFIGISKHPLMLIRGELSDLLTSQTVTRMKQIHASMTFCEIKEQGHAPKLETAGIAAQIAGFLEK